jgi:replication-associated recombination protein RarA
MPRLLLTSQQNQYQTTPKKLKDRIEHICAKENVTLAPAAFKLLASVAGGDLRRAVTTLQSAARLSGGNVDEQVCEGLLWRCCCVLLYWFWLVLSGGDYTAAF